MLAIGGPQGQMALNLKRSLNPHCLSSRPCHPQAFPTGGTGSMQPGERMCRMQPGGALLVAL